MILLLVSLVPGVYAQHLLPYCKNGKWGYADTSGKLVISPQFEAAECFSEGLACVKKDGACGFINKKGRLVIENKYTSAKAFKNNVAEVEDKSSVYLISREGLRFSEFGASSKDAKALRKKLQSEYSGFRFLHNGLCVVSRDTSAREGDKFILKKIEACYNREGKIVIPEQIWSISPLTEQLIYVKGLKGSYIYSTAGNIVLKDLQNILFAENGDKIITTVSSTVYLDSANSKLISFSRDYQFPRRISDRLFVFGKVLNVGFYYGIVTMEGRELVPAKYKYISGINEGRIITEDSKGNFGALDTSGRIIIPHQYQFMSFFSEGKSLAKENNSWLYINNTGKQEFRLDSIFQPSWSESMPVFNHVARYYFEPCFAFSGDCAVNELNGRYGYINAEGKTVIEPRYDYAEPFINGLACVYTFGPAQVNYKITCQLINREGAIVASRMGDYDIETIKYGAPGPGKEVCRYFTGCTFFRDEQKGWLMFDRSGNRISGVAVTAIDNAVTMDEKFIRVSTPDHGSVIIRCDGKLFCE